MAKEKTIPRPQQVEHNLNVGGMVIHASNASLSARVVKGAKASTKSFLAKADELAEKNIHVQPPDERREPAND